MATIKTLPIAQDSVLAEYSQHVDSYTAFPPTDSDFMAIHAGRMTLQGAVFAIADTEGFAIASAFPIMSDGAKHIVGRHMTQQYPALIGDLHNSPAGKDPESSERILQIAGKELNDEKRQILGGFVLMAFERTVSSKTPTILLPTVSKKVGLILKTIDEVVLRSGTNASEEEKDEILKLTQDEKYDEIKESIAMNVLGSIFPKPRLFKRIVNIA
ncbi:MAG: hypothetical protein ACHQT9_02785 [Candidatus Saccharimonadales bacterium]